MSPFKAAIQAIILEMDTDTFYGKTDELWAAIRVLENRSAVEERDALLAEVREWLCESCDTVYPGPPQKGVMCVVCPKCGGATKPRGMAERDALKEQRDDAVIRAGRLQQDVASLKAEVEELKKDEEASYGLMMKEKARAEKAEAELGNFCLYVRDYSNDSHIVARAKTIIKHLDEKEKL